MVDRGKPTVACNVFLDCGGHMLPLGLKKRNVCSWVPLNINMFRLKVETYFYGQRFVFEPAFTSCKGLGSTRYDGLRDVECIST